MNKRMLFACLFIAAITASLAAQGFVNLNFEDAIVSGSSGAFATSNALPGWSTLAGTNELSTIPYNPPLVGPVPPPVDLYGSNAYVLDGNFSVFLFGGSISQTGSVPSGTQSLLFDAVTPWRGLPLSVSLGGVNLSYGAIGSGTTSYGVNYTIFGADISPFAGQMETLTFSGGGYLDDIQFSPNVIPEPSSASLLFLGSGILLYVRQRRRLRL